MDLPTVKRSHAKQMIYSIINSQEEMNQQVLYLLGIGQILCADQEQPGERGRRTAESTSLAMQSLASGTHLAAAEHRTFQRGEEQRLEFRCQHYLRAMKVSTMPNMRAF